MKARKMRSWRNWQTRKTKDLVGNSMQVQFLSTAPSNLVRTEYLQQASGSDFLFIKTYIDFLTCLQYNIFNKKLS